MKLTPVRIRGKRKASNTATSTTPRPSKMLRSLQDVKHMRQRQPRTTLDRLPTEILEKILLYSGSVALPQCSPVVGAKLSSRATLLRFFIWGFHDTWDQWFGVPFREVLEGPKPKDDARGARSPQEAKYFPCDGDPELQSALLELPWVDMDLILRAQQTWADTYARHRWYEPHIPLSAGGYGLFDATRYFDAAYQTFTRHRHLPVRTVVRHVHPDVRLPVPLVTGPWNEERQRRLLWLVHGGINLEAPDSATRSLPWEYHVDFLRNAIVQAQTPNDIAYRLLRDQCDLMRVPADVLRQERDALIKRLQWGQHSELVFSLLQEVLEDVNYKLDYHTFSPQK
ncbi:hypothetical protein CCM_06536 [Cordyceps militaris CM01]|uniref:F-box domain-containing protein n=2 Tax=Cordyceps militaris TaxID=73501 RepID=G3JMT5_CORMM|nr:uncharacterized protein CCM_06536 [Cordyceps militaris CM01]ATY61679.1 hypothetical protein A9K55_008829 [Cordyceps militaris]EGX90117.1 hypothetical protein CCM_06536 [Cordyceps militaris CM01]